jgi:hypothetical protein
MTAHLQLNILLLLLYKFKFSSYNLKKTHVKFNKIMLSGSRIFPYGRTNMMKLIFAIRNFANSTRKLPKRYFIISTAWLEFVATYITACCLSSMFWMKIAHPFGILASIRQPINYHNTKYHTVVIQSRAKFSQISVIKLWPLVKWVLQQCTVYGCHHENLRI